MQVKIHVCVFVFDLLYVDGESLVNLPLRARRERMSTSLSMNPGFLEAAQALEFPPHLTPSGAPAIESAPIKPSMSHRSQAASVLMIKAEAQQHDAPHGADVIIDEADEGMRSRIPEAAISEPALTGIGDENATKVASTSFVHPTAALHDDNAQEGEGADEEMQRGYGSNRDASEPSPMEIRLGNQEANSVQSASEEVAQQATSADESKVPDVEEMSGGEAELSDGDTGHDSEAEDGRHAQAGRAAGQATQPTLAKAQVGVVWHHVNVAVIQSTVAASCWSRFAHCRSL